MIFRVLRVPFIPPDFFGSLYLYGEPFPGSFSPQRYGDRTETTSQVHVVVPYARQNSPFFSSALCELECDSSHGRLTLARRDRTGVAQVDSRTRARYQREY